MRPRTTKARGRYASLGRVIGAGGLTVCLGLLLTTPATAAPVVSQATANAINATVLGPTVVNSGTFTASNDGTTETTTGNANPALTVLGSQTLISAGALPQSAVANTDGTSGACAGVLGNDGTVQVGALGACTVSPSGGVTLTVPPLVAGADTVDIGATAIIGECQAAGASPPTATATADLADVTVSVLGTPITIPADPAPNTSVGIPGVATLVLNEQSSNGTGEINETAFDLTLLGAVYGGVHITLGNVTCGPNAQSAPTPIASVQAWPVFAGIGAAMVLSGGGIYTWRRHVRMA
jgi:hypothetical protein